MYNLSIIYVNYNSFNDLKNSIMSLKDNIKSISYEIIIIDNNSTEKCLNLKEIFSDIEIKIVFLRKNLGFGAANNIGANIAISDVILFLNTDVIITSDVIERLYYLLKKDKNIGILAPKLLNKDGSIQKSYGSFPTVLNETLYWCLIGKYLKEKKDWVSGAFMMIRKEVFFKSGKFDPNFFLYDEDIDLCKRVYDQGYKIVYCSDYFAYHIGGQTTNKFNKIKYKSVLESRLYYYKKHFSKYAYQVMKVEMIIELLTKIFIRFIIGLFKNREYNLFRISIYKEFLLKLINTLDVMI